MADISLIADLQYNQKILIYSHRPKGIEEIEHSQDCDT